MKITAPATSAHGPHQLDNPNTVWFVNGVGYTTDPVMIGYFQRTGFTVEAGNPDADHLAAVVALKDEAARTSMHTATALDGADAGRSNYFSGRS